MKLGGGVSALYKNLGRVRIWVCHIAAWVRTPPNVSFGYDVGKINAGCLVTQANTGLEVSAGKTGVKNRSPERLNGDWLPFTNYF